MPVYHFNVVDGVSLPDGAGWELPDLEAAQRAAMTYAGELLRDGLPGFWDNCGWRLSVTDPDGSELFSLLLSGILGSSPAAAMEAG